MRAIDLEVHWRCALSVLLGAWLVGCAAAPPPPPVLVTGAPEELGALVGEWSGQYWSVDTNRSGIIRFTLAADGASAHGDVWMSPAEAHRYGGGEPAPASAGPEPLEIRFVVVAEGGAVRGTLEPYHDPECGCMVSTTFEGIHDGDRITGTYTTRGGPTHRTTTGRWEVDRVAAGAAK
jgi:hypothetical protein